MAYDPGMKPPKGKRLAAPEIATDRSRIQCLEHDDENGGFRSWLNYLPGISLGGFFFSSSWRT